MNIEQLKLLIEKHKSALKACEAQIQLEHFKSERTKTIDHHEYMIDCYEQQLKRLKNGY
jgi:hypothetical protein